MGTLLLSEALLHSGLEKPKIKTEVKEIDNGNSDFHVASGRERSDGRTSPPVQRRCFGLKGSFPSRKIRGRHASGGSLAERRRGNSDENREPERGDERPLG